LGTDAESVAELLRGAQTTRPGYGDGAFVVVRAKRLDG